MTQFNCPQCGSESTQRLSVACAGGISSGTSSTLAGGFAITSDGLTPMVGTASTRTTQSSELARRLAAPTQSASTAGLEILLWAAGLISLGAILAFVGLFVQYNRFPSPLDFESIGNFIKATVEQDGANKFLKDLGLEVCRGMKRAAEAGRWINGKPPFGYRLVANAQLEINPTEAAIVKWAFESMLASDVSVTSICRELNRKGIPTPTGKNLWRVGTLRNMLRNPAYLGTKIYGQSPKGEHCRIIGRELMPTAGMDASRTGRQALSDCIVRENAYPPIIGQALFASVQRVLSARSRPKRTKTGSYPLSGLMHCGHCGKTCHGQKSGHGSHIYYYYACGSRKDCGVRGLPDDCSYLISADRLLDFITGTVSQEFLSDSHIDRYYDLTRKWLSERRGKHADREKALERQIGELDRKIEKLESRVSDAPDDMIGIVYGKIREARQQRDAAHLDLSGERRLGSITQQTASKAAKSYVGKLREIRSELTNADPSMVRRALQQVIERIEIFCVKPTADRKARKNTRRVLSHLRIHYRKDILSNDQDVVSGCSLDKIGAFDEMVVVKMLDRKNAS